MSATKDFGVTDADSNFVRLINRWRLEKANPRAKLSPPKKQIVWYVEDTVPIEYRPYVEEGIREWNKAFEKIGFKDAIAVRWEESGRDDFDPEDTNYCTFRWITTDGGYAMSCLRANPLTGEMIDGDVVFDAGFIRYWKQAVRPPGRQHDRPGRQAADGPAGHRRGDQPDPGLEDGLRPAERAGLARNRCARQEPQSDGRRGRPADQNFLAWQLAKNLARGSRGFCQFQSGFQRDFGLAAIAMADAKGPDKPAGDNEKDKDKAEKKKPEPKNELPEEFVGQAIKDIVMHEVGHSLGLRHNFKASTMLTADQLNDTAITHVKGLVGSVMDYSPINIAPKGKKQGDYYTTTIGPYDYWAIEYAYKPIDGDEAAELKKIAARAPEHDLVYATDEDSFLNDDPYVNRWDLGSDPCEFGKDRIALATELLERPGRPRGQGRRIVGADPPRLQRSCSTSGATARPWLRSTSAASRSRAITRPTRTPTTRSSRWRGPSSASA